MHGEREGRTLSTTSSQSMLTDNLSTSIESACLPIGCSVSAKYRGAFCSAQVKSIERQIKLKVTLIDTNDTITISEDQIVYPIPLRIGNTVIIRLPSTNSHHSRSGLAALINPDDNYDKKQAIIKQINDNSIYTVVFNDGDEKSLRRSSLCLQGIRLYQTQIGQQKLLEDIPTSLSTLPQNNNDITSIVAIQRHGNNHQHVFPALILKRKSLADYIWVKSFLDGREYIVHKHDDVQSYKNNSYIQSLCRLTSKQATKACEKFLKYNQIPTIWQKKKKKQLNNEQNSENNINDNNLNTSEPDVDDSDEETTEEKDSFLAQLFTFMDDRDTPINNIPKIHNYDLDLHRLFKIVRMLGGYNKVTKNNQWNKVYIKMGLPNEPSSKNSRSIEHAYKKYLFAYEDLSKKLGTINAPSAYFGGRTSMNSDSRRSLIRVRQQSEEKNKSKQISTKQQSSKRSSSTSTKNQSIIPRRKTIIINKTKSSNISESETSDDETTISSSSSNNNKLKKQQQTTNSIIKKSSSISNEKKKILSIKNSQQKYKRSISTPVKKTKSTTDTENNMKPIIKIPKISYEILMESTLAINKFPKRQTKLSKVQNKTSTNQSNKAISDQQQLKVHPSFSESINQTILQDLTPLPVTPVSPSPPPSITDELPSSSTNIPSISNPYDNTPEIKILETPSIVQTTISSSLITNQQTNEIENLPSNSNKRAYSDENSEYNFKINEQLSPSKRSRHSTSSQDSRETISNKQPITDNISRLTYEDILINDILLVKWDFNRKKQYYAKCIEKNNNKKELRIHYKGLDSKYDEWIEFNRVIKRQDEINLNEDEIIININSDNKIISNEQDNGIWKSLEIASMNEDDIASHSSTNESNILRILPSSSTEETTGLHQTISISNAFESINDDHIILQKPLTQNILSTTDVLLHSLPIKEEIIETSSTASILIEPIASSLLSIAVNNLSSDNNRRSSTRQQKRRTFRDSNTIKDSTKKKTKFDTDINSNFNIDSINNSDNISIPIEQQSVELKRCRTVGKRNGKRTVNQQDNENEDFHLNSLINGTLHQQLEDMFKHRTSRYNFLDLNNNLTGDNRLAHLKDRMRQCQKVFFNLKSALTKIEKQKKIFIQRQKLLIAQPTTNELLLPSTCT